MAVTWKTCPTTALFPLPSLNTEALQTLFSFYKLNTVREIISTVGQQSSSSNAYRLDQMPLLHFISTLLSKVQGVGVISFILTGRENLKEHRVGSLHC